MFSLASGMHRTVQPPSMADRPRIIVALPDDIECATIAGWLAAGLFEPVRRADPRTAARDMQTRAFDLLIADATFALRDGLLVLSRQRNPSTPTVVIGGGGDADLYGASGHAMYLGRPLDSATLLCTVSMAMMEGRPARRSARKIANHFDAFVHNAPSQIIDASYHGLQLQMSGRGMTALPPSFRVRVPIMGVSVNVQRIWARSAPGQATPVIWCGAALSDNRLATNEGWRRFVDMLPAVGRASAT
jgi:hypothetical protein